MKQKNRKHWLATVLTVMVSSIAFVTIIASLSRAADVHFTLPTSDSYEYSVTAPDGLTRWYFVDEPNNQDWTGETLSPVVFFFHGALCQAEDMYDLVKWNDPEGNYNINRDNVITVYPDGTTSRDYFNTLLFWNDGRDRTWDNSGSAGVGADDIGFVITMLDDLAGHYNVDTNKIYAAGVSNGGVFVQRLAIELPTRSSYRLAAVASVVGYLANPTYADYTLGNPLAIPAMVHNVSVPPTPIMCINGTNDKILNYNGILTGEQAVTLSAEQTITLWLAHNGQSGYASPTGKDTTPYYDQKQITLDGCKVYRHWWTNHAQATQRDVIFYRIEGGGHNWAWEGYPVKLKGRCMDFSATEDIWEFFSQHSL